MTKLIVKHYHEIGRHITGTNHTLRNLSTKYLIVTAREEICQWENECNECKRRQAKAAHQVMAPLPKTQLRLPLRSFTQISVDFGGPFITMQGRGKRRVKRWLCLFSCLLSRAIHLEMAYGLDTNSFLRCLTRMARDWGYPQEIVSDCSTNFIGAVQELQELVNQLDKKEIQERIVDQGIKWKFNPPLAPHFGGAHKIMIKAAKKAIYAILNNADINNEEALLNSWPLTKPPIQRMPHRLHQTIFCMDNQVVKLHLNLWTRWCTTQDNGGDECKSWSLIFGEGGWSGCHCLTSMENGQTKTVI